MFDPHRQPIPFKIPLHEPPQREFTITFSPSEAITLQMLADRAGVDVQEIVQKMLVGHPFSVAVSLSTGNAPPEMAGSRDEIFDTILYHIGLLKGAALSDFMASCGHAADAGQSDK